MIKEFYNHINGQDKITDNFIVKEFACKDGSDLVKIDIDLVYILQQIRNYINKPIKIISGYRTEDYNASCGGSPQSKHLQGGAIDFSPNETNAEELYHIAEMCQDKYKLNGIGLYINRAVEFIHIDNRTIDKKIVWINDKNVGTQTYYKNLHDNKIIYQI